jgi:2-polyprenyl-6-hydroxyphenyl methylase/3-demethylubiquinone-9 3-methyltransferase
MKKIISISLKLVFQVLQEVLLKLGLASPLKEGDLILDTQLRRHSDLLKYIQEVCPNFRNYTFLDIGCGRGELASLAHSQGFQKFMGVDWLPKVDVLNINSLQEYIQSNLNDSPLPFADQSFSHIVCSDVMEHLENPAKLLREIERILQLNGEAFLTIPNATNLQQRWRFLISGNSSRYKMEKINSWGHISFFTTNILASLLQRANLRLIQYSGGGWFNGENWILPQKNWSPLFSYNIIIHVKKL